MSKWKVIPWTKSDKTPGPAPTKDANEEALSRAKSPTAVTFVTGVMEQVRSKIFPQSPQPTTYASGIGKSGHGNMEWTESPQLAVERPLILLEALLVDLSPLNVEEQSKLTALSFGRGEPVAATIHQICEHFVDNEHPLAGEGTVLEAVRWYLENETIP